MNCSKQAESRSAGPLFKKSVTIEDIKMLIKILNQKLDVAIKAEFSFSNGDYTNVNTEEMLETKSDSYERVKKSKMSADAAEFVPMSHKIGFNCNGEMARNGAGLMKQLAQTYADRDSPSDISYAFTNENNSAGVKLLSEYSREEENETIKDERKETGENLNPNEENDFQNGTELEAKNYADSCELEPQTSEEGRKIQAAMDLKTASDEVFDSTNTADIHIVIDDGDYDDAGIGEEEEEKCNFQLEMFSSKSESENIALCNDFLASKSAIESEEENPERFEENLLEENEAKYFNLDNKNFSALNENCEESGSQYSLDDCGLKIEKEEKENGDDKLQYNPSNKIQDGEYSVTATKYFPDDLIAEKYPKLKMDSQVELMLGRLNKDGFIREEFVGCESKVECLVPVEEEFAATNQGESLIKDHDENDEHDEYEEVEDHEDDEGDDDDVKDDHAQLAHEKPLRKLKEDSVKSKLQAQIIEAIRCEMNTKDMSGVPCRSFEETLKEKCSSEINDDEVDGDNTASSNTRTDSIELEIVPEPIKCQWNSHLTNRMLAYSLHLKCTELANIYKAWSESTPPILPTKFWSMKKQNSYTMQSIAENISLVCLKCEVVQMKLEAEQQKLKYEEIDQKMQLSFQKESQNSELQKKLEEAWKKATKTEEILSHKIWAKRKNWFNIFALFYQKPDVILPRAKTFERVRRPFFSSNRERSRLFFRRAWRR